MKQGRIAYLPRTEVADGATVVSARSRSRIRRFSSSASTPGGGA
jgi:hypothetical protein